MEIANCSTKVSVYVPTKYSAKELVVKCGSMLSREYDIYCDRHDHQETDSPVMTSFSTTTK
jgi:hypothetical protein